MKVLLDTCALIWLCSQPDKFSEKASSFLKTISELELFISDATVLEIALKSSIGKLELPDEPEKWIEEQCNIWGIAFLPISRKVIYGSARLPWHHKDPFDRLIIASALRDDLPIITSDRFFSDYGVTVIW